MAKKSSETPAAREFSLDASSLASKVQETYDRVFDMNSFREPTTSSPALMVTNELLDKNLIAKIRDSSSHPDGVIFSVGAGITWLLPELFSNKEPKIIVGFDFDPEVVFLGRLVVGVLKDADSFDEFLLIVEDSDKLKIYGEKVADETNNEDLRKIFKNIDINSIRELILRAISLSGIIRTTKITDVVAHFRENFVSLKNMACEDKIAFVFVDLLNKETISLFNVHLSQYREHVNIVYTSNISDYLGAKKLKYLKAIRGWHLSTSSRSNYSVEAKLIARNWLQSLLSLFLGR